MKLRFNRFAEEKAFRSPRDFSRFASNQKNQFDALRQKDAQQYEAWAKTVSANWATVIARADDPEATTGTIAQALAQHPVVTFESTLAKRLMTMTSQGRTHYASQLMPFLGGAYDNRPANNLQVSTLNAYSEFLAAILQDSVSRGASLTEALADQERRLEALLEVNAEQLAAGYDRFEQLLDKANEELGNLASIEKDRMAAREASWTETHHAFIEQLSTETAVALWEKRSDKHLGRYKSFRRWAIGFGVAGLAITLAWIFGGFAAARHFFPNDKTAQIASYSAGSVALFTLFVWGLRVLVRSMMSEDHLATDASARSALAHTYLALTKEEAATAEDRAIILATLFAPVSDGLVKDDGMPTFSPAALAAQVLTKPGFR